MALKIDEKIKQPGKNFSSLDQPSRQVGTGFTNLQQYLKANRGSQVGQAIGGSLQKQAGSAQQQLGQAGQQIQGQLSPEQQRLQQSGQQIQSALQDPTKFIQNQQNVEQFQKLREGQLGIDPNLVRQQAANALAQSANAQNLARLAQSTGGRQQLLQRTFNAPGYTRGQQKLDQLILESSPEQARALAGSANQINRDVGRAQQQFQGTTADQLANIEQMRSQALQQIKEGLGQEATGEAQGTGQLGTLVDTVEDRALKEQAKRQQVFNELQKYLSTPGARSTKGGIQEKATDINTQLSPEAQALLGKDPNLLLRGEGTKDLLNKYLTQGNIATTANVATPEELARYQALSKLAGQPGQFLTEEGVKGAQPLGDPTAFNSTQYQQEAKERLNSEVNPLIESYKQQAAYLDQLRNPARSVHITEDTFRQRMAELDKQFNQQMGNVATKYGTNLDQQQRLTTHPWEDPNWVREQERKKQEQLKHIKVPQINIGPIR